MLYGIFVLIVCGVGIFRFNLLISYFSFYSSYCALAMQIRPIIQSDNPALAKIIRDTLTEFGVNRKSARFLPDFIDG